MDEIATQEATALSEMTELDLSSNFGSSYNHIDHSVLTNSSRMSHEHEHSDANVSQNVNLIIVIGIESEIYSLFYHKNLLES